MVTLADVAERAGVSASTVSYVLSGKRSISGPTRARVLEAIEALGYHPHAGARSLASSRSDVLALMVPLRSDMYVPVIMEIVTAVATAARVAGQDVLLLTGEEGTSGVRRVAGSGSADALILMDVELDDERLPVLRETGLPAVLIGMPHDDLGLTCIDLDFAAAGAACVDHLADLGHRDIAFLGESDSVYRRRTGFAVRTLDGFRTQAARRGVRAMHRSCEGSYESTVGVVSRIVEERPSTTGFVVQNEAALPALLTALRRLGRPVPEENSVVAICPDQVALQASPRLTSVAIPADEMGGAAVRLAMAQLAGEATTGTTLLPPVLTVRDSSAPVADTAGSDWSRGDMVR